MVKFSIPYNSDLETVEEIIRKYKTRIEEIYFAIDSNIASASKPSVKGPGVDEARRLVKILAKNRIKSNILINAAYEGNRNPQRMKDFIRSIGGVNGITIADLYLLEVFKGFGPKMHISRVAQLNSVEKIRRILTRYPDLTINIDNDLNRDLAALKKIYSLKDHFPNFRIKLMVNEGCLFHCTGRTRHSWLICLGETEKKYFGHIFNCLYQASLGEVDKEMIKSPFIRPEDLSFYEKNRVVDIFKLAGRQIQGRRLLTTVDAYMRKGYAGSLLDLMGTRVMINFSQKYLFDIDNKRFPKDFIRKVTACDKFCAGCNYCADLAGKVMVAPKRVRKLINKDGIKHYSKG